MRGGTRQGAGSDVVVTFDAVSRRFGDVTAVDTLTFVLARGETVALLGPNGAGKTTTVELLLGLLPPDTGAVRLFGGPPADAVTGGRVAAMLQDAGLPEGLTVTELIELMRRLYPHPLGLAETLDLLDLDGVAGARVERLSGGQRQRVRLAAALAGNPELLVLDEPTAALDVAARRRFWQRARLLVSDGRALLFATHRLEEAEVVADRVLVMANGSLVTAGSVDEVRARARGRSVVRFSADGLPLDRLERLPGVEAVESDRGQVALFTTDPDSTVRELLRAAPGIAQLEVARAGLEDAFLTLTSEEDA